MLNTGPFLRLLCGSAQILPAASSLPLFFSQKATNEHPDDSIAQKALKDNIQVREGNAKMLEKKKLSILGTSDVPSNINFPNPKGAPGFDPEISAKEILESLPKVVKQQSKLVAKEAAELLKNASVEKTQLLEEIGHLRHNEARIEYRFDSDEGVSLWKTGCDSDWNEGFSKCSLHRTTYGTAIFSGNINTQPVKDGRIERAGWATMKLEDRRSFNRKKMLSHWAPFSQLLLKIRGDGRSYKVMLHTPLSMDFTWGDSFSHPLHTHGGPYWQYERIPFSRFFHTIAGRVQDRQYRVNLQDCSSLGIVQMDRMDGDFRLEIDYVGVCHDTTHFEEFGYETYTLPVFNTHGF